jgi:hypothetical protein
VIELEENVHVLIASKGLKALKAVNISVIWMEKDYSGEGNGNYT